MTNNTVGAAMIIGPLQESERSDLENWKITPHGGYMERQRALVMCVSKSALKSKVINRLLFSTGLTGSRKRSIAYALERRLFESGVNVVVLDGQKMRLGLGQDLGFSVKGRDELATGL